MCCVVGEFVSIFVMWIFVIGVCGKVGAAVVNGLVLVGYGVVGCDFGVLIYEGGECVVFYIQADLSEVGDVFVVVCGCDVVIHCVVILELI